MSLLTLDDLLLVLDDLFENQLPLLEATSSWKLYQHMLQDKRDAIKALSRDGIRLGEPLAEELEDADFLHDGLGSASRLLLEACLRNPRLDGSLRRAAHRLLDYVSDLSELQRPFEVEASLALERMRHLEDHESDLKRFPTPDGGSLYDWVSSHLEQGLQLSRLLSRRQELKHQAASIEPSASVPLRSTTLGLLRKLRERLQDEVTLSRDLDRDLVRKIFALYDREVTRQEIRSSSMSTAALTY